MTANLQEVFKLLILYVNSYLWKKAAECLKKIESQKNKSFPGLGQVKARNCWVWEREDRRTEKTRGIQEWRIEKDQVRKTSL